MKLLCYLVLFFSCSIGAVPLNFSGKTLEVPLPNEMIEVTPDMGELFYIYQDIRSAMSSSTNYNIEGLTHFISVADALNEDNVELRNCIVSNATKINEIASQNHMTITNSHFNLIKKTILGLNDDELQKMINNTNLSSDILTVDNARFGKLMPILNTDESISIMSVVSGNYQYKDIKEDSETLLTMSVLNVKNKIMVLYCYAPIDKGDWLKQTTLDWINQIHNKN